MSPVHRCRADRRMLACTVAAMVVTLLTPVRTWACDPLPPHISDAQPPNGAVTVPSDRALVLRVAGLSAAQDLTPTATLDGAPTPLDVERIDFGPTVPEAVDSGGALFVLLLPPDTAAGTIALTLPGVYDKSTLEDAEYGLGLGTGTTPTLSTPPNATGTLGPVSTESYGTCGEETGRRLSVDVSAPGAVAAVLWVEDASGPFALNTAIVPTGETTANIDGLVDGALDAVCFTVEAWGPAGDTLQSARTCVEASPALPEAADDAPPKGGCATVSGLPLSQQLGWGGLLVAATRRRRR